MLKFFLLANFTLPSDSPAKNISDAITDISPANLFGSSGELLRSKLPYASPRALVKN
jgi:hypothetical protein